MSPLLIVDRKQLQALARLRHGAALLLIVVGAVGGYALATQAPTWSVVQQANAAAPAMAAAQAPRSLPWCQQSGSAFRLSCTLSSPATPAATP
jgi:hypothetical protein